MKYVPPYGREAEGDSAQYINGDPSIGRQGSIPPADAFEHPMREIVGVIDKSKFVPNENDLLQLIKSVRSQRINFADDTGSANVLSVAFDPPLNAYTLGLPIHVRVHQTNTGGSSIDAGAGRVSIIRSDGNALSNGDLPAGGIVDMMFDGTNFQLVNFLGAGGSGSIVNNYNNIPYVVDTSPTPNIVTANFAPAITTLAAGTAFLVKIANTNTADSIINVNTFTNKAIRANSGGKLLPGDLAAGDIKIFVYDGTNFYIEPNELIPSDVSILVPSQFAQPQDAINAISRKTIAKSATLTIQIAAGVFNGFVFHHKDASRIVIKGTMLATRPAFANFGQNGNANLIMLRSRYGTEIVANSETEPPASGGPGGHYQCAIQNACPGNPVFRDLLVTGPNTWALTTFGVYCSYNGAPGNNFATFDNVAAWGCYYGFWTGGGMQTSNCSSTNNQNGYVAWGGGWAGGTGLVIMNNGIGFRAQRGSTLEIKSADVWYNNYGAYCVDGSQLTFQVSNIYGSGTLDLYAANLSILVLDQTGASTMSPSPNTGAANNGSYNVAG